MKERPGVVPAMALVAVTLFVGCAFIKLGAEQRRTRQHATAARMAESSAYAMERELEGVFEAVETIADEMSRGGTIEDFRKLAAAGMEHGKDTQNFFLISDGHVADGYPLEVDPSRSEGIPVGLPIGDGHFGEPRSLAGRTAILPAQMTTGEWRIFVRCPLVLLHREGSNGSGASVVASVELDKLIQGSGLGRLSRSDFDYQLSYRDSNDGHSHLFAKSSEFPLRDPVQQVISLRKEQWSLSLAPTEGWSPWSPIILHSLLVGILALGGGVATYDLARRPERLRRGIEKRDQRLKITHQRLIEEVRRRGEIEKQLSHASGHDALTGLPNRSYLMNRLERALSRARRQPGSQVAVIVLNFDRFKNINESLGYRAGDELLTQAVRRFESCLRPEDIVGARLSGDEFAMLLFDIVTANDAAAVAQRLHHTLVEPFNLEGQRVFATASMGIALSASGYENGDELMRAAHIALSKAKAEGRARHAVFDPATREQVVISQQLESDLHRAIERREF